MITRWHPPLRGFRFYNLQCSIILSHFKEDYSRWVNSHCATVGSFCGGHKWISLYSLNWMIEIKLAIKLYTVNWFFYFKFLEFKLTTIYFGMKPFKGFTAITPNWRTRRFDLILWTLRAIDSWDCRFWQFTKLVCSKSGTISSLNHGCFCVGSSTVVPRRRETEVCMWIRNGLK
jgi:hypothetical protein